MRYDIKLNGQSIECESAVCDEDFHESIFFEGNGRVGMRGYLPYEAEKRPLKAGLYVAGIFENISGDITDIVHLPTPVCENAYAEGNAFCVNGNVKRRLDLQTGVFTAEYMLVSDNAKLAVTHERFAVLHNAGYIVQRTQLTAVTEARFTWKTGISLAPRNNPVPDDQVKTNSEVICLYEESAPRFDGSSVCAIDVQTPKTELRVRYNCIVHAEGISKEIYLPGSFAGFEYGFHLKAGDTVEIEKLCFITTSRDCDETIKHLPRMTYAECFDSHKKEWAKRLSAVHLPTMPNEDATTATRYAVAQLIMNGPAHDATVSIGARGLTHPRYKGCYFWDTDFFLLPFYERTHPQTAKNLVRYRINNLAAAKAHAAKTSSKGARYPWMASLTGSEQCESWDIGFAEVHITADIVFAIDHYIRTCGDTELYAKAAEVYIETARFWTDRCTRGADGKANLLFVKGPDEYCGITNNNLFTVMMVKHNLALAAEAAERYPELASAEETESWRRLAEDLPIARNAQGHLRQDDTFDLLESVALETLKHGDEASYHSVSFDRVQRYRVIKQADLLLIMTRMPELFSREEKLQAWEDYEPLCLHDSTLSFASHALFAAQNGLTEKAAYYLEKALFLDLRDIMGNTGHEGLHLANFGETMQAIFS